MPKTKRTAALAMVILAVSTAGYEAAVTKTKFRGETARATASQEVGCIFTSIELSATESRARDSSGRTESTSVLASVTQFDVCTSQGLLNAFGNVEIPQGDLSVPVNLNRADLSTTVVLTDHNNNPYPIALDLTWKRSGDQQVTQSTQKSSSPGTLTILRSRQEFGFNAVVAGTAVLPDGITLNSFTGQLFKDISTTMTRKATGIPPFLRGPSRPATFTSATGYGANAFFSGNSNSGCLSTEISLGAFQSDTLPAPGESGMTLSIFLVQFDSCTSTQRTFVIDQRSIPVGVLTVARNLSSASLIGAVDFTDFVSGLTIPVAFDLSWAATETGTLVNQRVTSSISGVEMDTLSRGSFANALVSGSVSTPVGSVTAPPDTLGSVSKERSRTTLITPASPR